MDKYQIIPKIRRAFCRETSELPEKWSEAYPSTGQCHVSALILKKVYRGHIVSGIVNGETLHYWNFIDGMVIDITLDQFDHVSSITQISNSTYEPINSETLEKHLLLMNLSGI